MKKNQKTERIMIRCTPEQKDVLLNAADSVGLSLSEYIRIVALGDAKKAKWL